MKITDLTLSLFAWDGIPATSYGAHSGKFSGSSVLGLLAIETDAAVAHSTWASASSREAPPRRATSGVNTRAASARSWCATPS